MDNLNAREHTENMPESLFSEDSCCWLSIIRFWLFCFPPRSRARDGELRNATKTKIDSREEVLSVRSFDFFGYLLEWNWEGNVNGSKKIDVLNSMLGGFLRLTRFWLFINDKTTERRRNDGSRRNCFDSQRQRKQKKTRISRRSNSNYASVVDQLEF